MCAAALIAQNAGDVQRCEDTESYRHVRTTEPLRPNGSLRRDNISDEAVREVERAALEVFPAIVSIFGVTDGCDCEDGSKCTAQVWLALYRENQTRSLALSKIDGHWKIGALRNWLLQYNAHQTSSPGFGRDANQLAWQQENQRLLDNFPACQTAPANWMLLRSDGYGSTCVDMSSIKVSGFIRRVIFKQVHAPPKQTYSFPWTRYWINLAAFDCKDHRSGPTQPHSTLATEQRGKCRSMIPFCGTQFGLIPLRRRIWILSAVGAAIERIA